MVIAELRTERAEGNENAMTEWELSRSFTSSSGAARWERLGPSGAPPVVLLHGTP